MRTRQLGSFVKAWQGEVSYRHVHVEEVLRALEVVAATGRITEALPPELEVTA